MSRMIEFGRYRKDDTGPVIPIEWQALRKDENTIFLVAQHAVAKRYFDEEYRTWKDSEIRKWLNESFYERAFSSSEKQCIQPTQVDVMDWEGTSVDWTEDRIFLLSMEEFRMCAPTQTEEWWLRDQGICDSTAVLVRKDGSFDPYANTQTAYGIRPAIRILKNYEELVVPEIPMLEGQMKLFDDGRFDKNLYMEIEAELDEILIQLGMNPPGNRREFRWLKEVILLAVHFPSTWQVLYLEMIGKREGITRERVRQILYKAVWDNWNVRSAFALSDHFGHAIQMQFERVKPNHIEFVRLLSEELRKTLN